jgi:hypothetical protein
LHTSSHIYLATAVVDDATGGITTYPAVYAWNQNRVAGAGGTATPSQSSDLTPEWNGYHLAPVVIESVPDTE